MKRFNILFFGALAMIMAGCSKNELPAEKPLEPWVNDLSLPVPIQFSSPNLFGTKAPSLEEVGDLQGKAIGVFAVNKDPNAAWTDSKNVLLSNEYATYEGGKLKFSKTQYYPVQSNINYTFYGYYIRQNDVQQPVVEQPVPAVTPNGFSVELPIGTIDYLWAKSEATTYNTTDGFNARYIREITKGNATDTHMPKFDFQHVTSAVNIVAKMATSTGESLTEKDFEDISMVHVTVKKAVSSDAATTFENGIKSAKLCIADKTGSQEGKFFAPVGATPGAEVKMTAGSDNRVYLDTATWQDAGVTKTGFHPTEKGTKVGHGLFLLPGYKYTIEVQYRSNATNGQLASYTFETKPLDAGTRYTYTLLFHQSKGIDISVALQSWKEEVGGELDTSK